MKPISEVISISNLDQQSRFSILESSFVFAFAGRTCRVCLWDKAFLPCDIVQMLNDGILTALLTDEQKKKKSVEQEALMLKTLLSDGVTFAMLRASQEEVTYI